jgi:hypothetical protein
VFGAIGLYLQLRSTAALGDKEATTSGFCGHEADENDASL